MTKKHYVMIAEVFNKADKYTLREGQGDTKTMKTTIEVLASDLAEALKEDNPLFNEEKFLAACGIQFYKDLYKIN